MITPRRPAYRDAIAKGRTKRIIERCPGHMTKSRDPATRKDTAISRRGRYRGNIA
jgi:hypothetical protein